MASAELLNATPKNDTVVGYLQGVFDQVLTQYVVAVIILLVGMVLGKLVEVFLARFLRELELNRIVKTVTRFPVRADLFIANVVAWIIYIFTILFTLNQLGIATVIVNALSIFVIILILILALLATKDYVPNMLAGFYLHANGRIRKGEMLKMQLVRGKIVDFNLFEVEVQEKDEIIHIPYSAFMKQPVKQKK